VKQKDGWAMDFRYELDKERYNSKGAGKGWSVGNSSKQKSNRYQKADSWSAYFKPHYNVERYCKNKGWAIDFRSNLNPKRFNSFNSNFFVMPASKYEALRFNDSFSTSKKSKEGAFSYSEKDKTVKQKFVFRFKKKPITNDTFGPNVKKREYTDNVYNKKKKAVTKKKKIFKRKREKPYKRKDDMNLDLFPFKP